MSTSVNDMQMADDDDGQAKSLSDIPFANLYMILGAPETSAWSLVRPYKGVVESTLPCFQFPATLTPDLINLASQITTQIHESPRRREFCITYPAKGEDVSGDHPMRLRVVWSPSALVGTSVVCRRLEAAPPPIADLGFDPAVLEWFTKPGGAVIREDSQGYRPGGVVFCGNTSAGKTTSMTALIINCLTQIGGFCYALGTSPEYDIEGAISDRGFLVQIPVDETLSPHEWEDASIAALKWNPAIVAFGEIGHTGPAKAFITTSSSNRLVTATMHAASIPDAIDRLAALASTSAMEVENNKKILANNLSLIIYQELTEEGVMMQILDLAAWRKNNPGEVRKAFDGQSPDSVVKRALEDTLQICKHPAPYATLATSGSAPSNSATNHQSGQKAATDNYPATFAGGIPSSFGGALRSGPSGVSG